MNDYQPEPILCENCGEDCADQWNGEDEPIICIDCAVTSAEYQVEAMREPNL